MDRFIIWQSILNFYDTILTLVHNFLYTALAVMSMRSMNIRFRDLHRSIWVSSHVTWLQMLLLGFMVCWIINLNSFAIYAILQQPWWCAFTTSIYALTAFLFVNAIMFVLLLKPDLYYLITKYSGRRRPHGERKTVSESRPDP